MITVFYDGKCGLCRTEIQHYQKIAPVGIFEWCDITTDTTTLHNAGIHTADALKILHTIDNNGTVHTGVKSTILIWQQLRYFKILAMIAKFPPIYWILHVGYMAFAKWRFKRLPYCKMD